MAKNNIMRDLVIGSAGEQFVIDIFKKYSLLCSTNNVKKDRQFWDLALSLKDREFKFEVKYDLYCAKSGNIAIEFFNPKAGKPSGLSATKADFWVQVLTNPMSAWLAQVRKLRSFCDNTKPDRIITSGGDDNSSMYLYKKDLILDSVFARIDELDQKALVKLLNDCSN